MSSLASCLTEIVSDVFVQLDLPAELGRVMVSDRPDLAQFQCNGAMNAARLAKKAPRQIAEDIVVLLKERKEFSSIDIAGPGFINLNVCDAFLQNYLQENIITEKFGVRDIGQGQTIMLDYGGYNVGKPLHVGHLRSSIIGDSLHRILSYVGYNPIGDVHLGDWGTQMGMILSELEMRYPEWVYFDPDFSGDYPKESPLTIEDFEEIYPTASKACKADPLRHESAKKATIDLQNKKAGYYALWQHFMNVSLQGMKDSLKTLDIYFDLWKGEADVHDLIAPMVQSLKDKNFAVESEGAVIVPVESTQDNKEFPPLILYKSDGAVMYGTTDLATIIDRVKEYHPSKLIYVVDQRQHLHFEQVFRAAKKTGIAPNDLELIHAGFGTMNGTDGKPFKTRAGGVMKLEDFLSMAIEKASKRLEEAHISDDLSSQEKQDIAAKIGISAIKFADLQNNRMADYIFDLDRLTSFEGKTGPYILYQAVRIRSLLKKAGAYPLTDILVSEDNKALLLLLSTFPDVMEGVCKHYTPHILCDYVYSLAQSFSSFYNTCHILSEEEEALRLSHLNLCALVFNQIETCMELLGIQIPERM